MALTPVHGPSLCAPSLSTNAVSLPEHGHSPSTSRALSALRPPLHPLPPKLSGPRHPGGGGGGRDALEGNAPRRRPQKRLDRRLEGVAQAVGGGYCRLQSPLKPALAVRETAAGHRLSALEGGGDPPLSNASLEVGGGGLEDAETPPLPPTKLHSLGNDRVCSIAGAAAGGTPRGRGSTCEQRDNCPTLTICGDTFPPVAWGKPCTQLIPKTPNQRTHPELPTRTAPPPPPRVTLRPVVASLRGPGQSPVLPFACCVGSPRSVGRCGRCSCWCRFRVPWD